MDVNLGAIKVQLTDEDPRAIEAGSGAVTKFAGLQVSPSGQRAARTLGPA
jgi:hypothetical protein